MFTKSRPKYVQHVRALYPNASQPQRKLQNLSALIHFAQTNPKYLKEIGAYLNHRIRKHVQKAEIGKIVIPVLAMCSLIDSGDSNLARVELWQEYIKASVLFLVGQSDPQNKIYAMQILEKYAKKSHAEEFQESRLDVYFLPISELISYQSSDLEMQVKVRQSALLALEQVLLFNDERSSADHFREIIPLLLSNVEHFPEAWSDVNERKSDEKSFDYLSLKCLIEIAHIVDLTNISKGFIPIFEFLDSMKWTSVKSASTCIRLVSDNCKKLPNGFNIGSELLRHVDLLRKNQKNHFLNNVLQTISEVILRMKLPLGPWEGALRLLLQLLSASVEESNLHFSFFKIVSAYCLRMANAEDQLKLIDHFCHLIAQKSTPEKLSKVLLKCVNLAVLIRKNIGDSRSSSIRSKVISKLTNDILQKFMDSLDYEFFSTSVLEMISFLLLPDRLNIERVSYFDLGFDLETHMQESRLKIDSFVHNVLKGSWSVFSLNKEGVGLFVSSEMANQIREFLYNDLSRKNTTVSTLHFKCLCLMLFDNPFHELSKTAPMLFHLLQTSNLKKSGTYALVFSYFSFLCNILSSPKVEALSKQKSLQNVCAQMELFLVSHIDKFNALSSSYFISGERGLQKTDSQVLEDNFEFTFERDQLVQILSQIELPEDYPHSLSEIFSSDYQHQNMTDFSKKPHLYQSDASDHESSSSLYEDDYSSYDSLISHELNLQKNTSEFFKEPVSHSKPLEIENYSALLSAIIADHEKKAPLVRTLLYSDEMELENLHAAEEIEEYSSDSGKEEEFDLQNLDFIRPSSRTILGLPDEPSQILRPKLNDTIARLSLIQTKAILKNKNDAVSPVRRAGSVRLKKKETR